MIAWLIDIINDFYSTQGLFITGITGILGLFSAALLYCFIKTIKDILDWICRQLRKVFFKSVSFAWEKIKCFCFDEIAKAFKRLSDADEEEKAKRGDKNAQYNLGCSYNEGQPSSEQRILAIMWLIIASANGSEEAQSELDCVYEELGEESYKLFYAEARIKENEMLEKYPRIYRDLSNSLD